MSGKLQTIMAGAIWIIGLLAGTSILVVGSPMAQEHAPLRGNEGSGILALHAQHTENEQERSTARLRLTASQVSPAAPSSPEEVRRLVEHYQAELRRLDSEGTHESTSAVCLQLGRYNFYLRRFDEAEAFLDRASKLYASAGDRTGKARVLTILAVLHAGKKQFKSAASFLDQALRSWGDNGDSESQGQCLKYGALVSEESKSLGQTIEEPDHPNDKDVQRDENHGHVWFVRSFVRMLRTNGLQDRAEQLAEQSVTVARETGDKKWEASALDDLANVYKDRGQFDRAFVRYLKSLKIYEEMKDGPKQTALLNKLGRVLLVQGKNQEAISSHDKALTIAQAAGDLKGQAVSMGGLGAVYQSMGAYDKAAECHEQSRVIVQTLGNVRGESYTLDHLGTIFLNKGEYAKAADYYEKSLAIRRKIGHPKGEANSLNKLGALYQAWGQQGKALRYLEESLEISKRIVDVQGEATSLNKLGEVCHAWGQYDKAMEYFEKSLEISRKIGDVKGEAACLNNLGRVFQSWGQYDKALECFERSLVITRKIGDVKGEAAGLNNVGRVFQSWGQYDKALECYGKALEITRKIGDVQGEARGLRSMGIISASLGKHEEAGQYYERVLDIEGKLGLSTSLTNALFAQLCMDKGDLDCAEIFVQKSKKPIARARLLLLKSDFRGAKEIYEGLFKKAEADQHWTRLFVSCTGLGMALEGLGEYEAAAEHYRRAIKLTEKERTKLSASDREAYFDVKIRGMNRTAPYEGLARVLVRMNQPERAFRISELAKARAFAEAISRKPAKMPFDVPAEVLAKSQALGDRASELESRREKAVQYADKELQEYLQTQINQVEHEIREYRKSLREAFPVFAATRYPTRSLPLKESAIRENEWILSYDATDGGLLIYLVHGKRMVRGIMQPIKKRDLEELVRRFRTPLELEPSDTYQQKMEKLRSFDFAAGRELADLLVKDFLNDLPRHVPVIVIPDDSLADLPFEMLVLNDQGRIEDKDLIPFTIGAQFFGDRHPVSYYQSVTALTLARTFGTQEISGNRLLVVADPVTDPTDERITSDAVAKYATVKDTPHRDSTISLLNDRSGLAPVRLMQTKELAQHLSGMNAFSEVLMGFDASKRKLLSEVGPRLAEFKHIVFATHGSYGSTERGITEPVLCLTLIPQGTDGLLRMSEVMGLKLNADLVALTACQSGLGKKIPGEGIMGMGRAFQYAGARSVLMSLWSVQATASTKLVEVFYRKLMDGHNKLDALTLARKEVRSNGFDHPFFWAGLILAGERD